MRLVCIAIPFVHTVHRVIISLWLITLAEDSTYRNNYFVHKEAISDNGESAIVLSGSEDDDSDFDPPNKATSTKCHQTK